MKGKKTILLIFILLVGGFFGYRERVVIADVVRGVFEKDIPAVSYTDVKNDAVTPPVNQLPPNSNANVAAPIENPIPAEFNLQVPFTTQAPDANWDFPYQEACEEASALTVHYYYQNKTFTKEIADREILKLVEWEKDYFGDYKDTTAEETAEFIKVYWGYKRVDVEYDPTVEQIKRHVADGRPVIVPAAGKQLGNPNFRNGGPLYHMFVIRGYTKSQFITNDVGTRKGENYRYDIPVIMSAMHDWNGGDVENGQKAIVIVYPND